MVVVVLIMVAAIIIVVMIIIIVVIIIVVILVVVNNGRFDGRMDMDRRLSGRTVCVRRLRRVSLYRNRGAASLLPSAVSGHMSSAPHPLAATYLKVNQVRHEIETNS